MIFSQRRKISPVFLDFLCKLNWYYQINAKKEHMKHLLMNYKGSNIGVEPILKKGPKWPKFQMAIKSEIFDKIQKIFQKLLRAMVASTYLKLIQI